MSRFTGPLSIVFQDEPERAALLLEDLIWEIDDEGSGKFVIVKKGFLSDGGSIPWWLWWFIPPWGDRSTRAYILHDFLRSRISWGIPHPYAPSFKDCDYQFLLAMLALKVPKWKAYPIYWIVALNTFLVGDRGEAYGPPIE